MARLVAPTYQTKKGLLKSWPEKVPGWFGLLIRQARVIQAQLSLAIAFDGNSGQPPSAYWHSTPIRAEIWNTPIGGIFKEGHGNGPGPRRPSMFQHLRHGGEARSFAWKPTAARVWSKHLRDDFDGELMSGWGYCESPLVDGETRWLHARRPKGRPSSQIGQKDGQTYLALHRSQGQVLLLFHHHRRHPGRSSVRAGHGQCCCGRES